MAKIKDIANEAALATKNLLEKLRAAGIEANANTNVADEHAEKVLNFALCLDGSSEKEELIPLMLQIFSKGGGEQVATKKATKTTKTPKSKETTKAKTQSKSATKAGKTISVLAKELSLKSIEITKSLKTLGLILKAADIIENIYEEEIKAFIKEGIEPVKFLKAKEKIAEKTPEKTKERVKSKGKENSNESNQLGELERTMDATIEQTTKSSRTIQITSLDTSLQGSKEGLKNSAKRIELAQELERKKQKEEKRAKQQERQQKQAKIPKYLPTLTYTPPPPLPQIERDEKVKEKRQIKVVKTDDKQISKEIKIEAQTTIETTQEVPVKRKIIIVNRGKESQQTKTRSEIRSEPLKPISEIVAKESKDSKKKVKKTKKELKKTRIEERKLSLNRRITTETLIDDEKNEVMLFDFNESIKENLREEERQQEERQEITKRVTIQRSNPWFLDGIKKDNKRRRGSKHRSIDRVQMKEERNKTATIIIPDELRVYEFADKTGLSVSAVLSKLFRLGEMLTKNDFLNKTMIELLAAEFNLTIELSKSMQELEYLEEDSNTEINMIARAPVVTIMGHVDHGKTSLLDYIRNTRVSRGEHGGITQQIGAYVVSKNGKKISFLDTPGHEAFANMRERGAQVTDIAIIVIAADDGVKEQTKEALSHAKDAGVEIIIAMNKIDKKEANIDRLKSEMADLGYLAQDWGGTYDFVGVSAKTGEGVEELLDTILLHAEIMNLEANIAATPKAVILEGSLDKGKGPVVTLMMKEGILKTGDNIVADRTYGKIRALIGDNGERLKELYPSEVALLTGLNEVPPAGSILVVVESDAIAREYANKRASYLRAKDLSKTTKVSLDDLNVVVEQSRLETIPLIVKADTQGSLEALCMALEELSNNEVKINIIQSSVGSINESDISVANISKSVIIGFNVKPLGILKMKAKENGVEIVSYNIIYDALSYVKTLISTLMSPIVEENIIGSAEVRNTFATGKNKADVIAGCFVNDGSVARGAKVKLIRKDAIIYTGNISSLKRFKDDVREVGKGYECGITLENFNDISIGDVIQTYKEIQKLRKI